MGFVYFAHDQLVREQVMDNLVAAIASSVDEGIRNIEPERAADVNSRDPMQSKRVFPSLLSHLPELAQQLDKQGDNVPAKVEEQFQVTANEAVTGFKDENGLAPIITHFEPPAKPHHFESATIFFIRYAFGGAEGIAVIVIAICFGIPLLSHLIGVPMFALYTCLVTAGITRRLYSNAAFWHHHMRPALEREDCQRPFLTRRVGTRPHKQRKGKTVWYPKLSEEESKTRGFAPYGMPLPCYFYDLLTYALEYKVCGFCRAVCCDLNIGKYKSTQCSAEDVYFFIMNTSMACFISKDDGKLNLYENHIPHPNGKTIYMYKVVGELDHRTQRHIRTWIQYEEAKEGCRPEVITITDPTEVVQVYGLIGATKTHVHIHWWANAVKDLEDGKWPLANLSIALTQGFNNAAQFTAGPMLGCSSPEGFRAILLPNAICEGIPVHSDLGEIANRSRLHSMVKSCRAKLRTGAAKHLNSFEIEAILQATVMHAAEHYYASAVMPWRCYSHFMDAELTPFRATLIQGCQYRTRNLLCKHYRHEDPICASLYECCHEIDPAFADTHLTVGIAA